MANKVIKVRNKVKYDTEANWAKADPVLLAGELAVSSDRNNRIKVGNGTSKWSALAFSGLKVGSNITLSNDTISLTKSNVTTALGYTPPTTNTTYNDATQSVHGLMSTADKTKLDGIATGANKTVVDNAMSTSSTNPVQNKVVKTEIDKKMNIEATPLTSEDLNNIKTYGFYYGGGSNTVKNKPSSVDAFALHVYRSASGYVVQELTDANVNERSKYIRQFTSSSWSAWLPEATFSANPTNGQIIIADGTTGKVKTSGYTIASSVPSGAKFTDTVYTHPSYTAKASGLYKVTVDDKGHVSATTAVTKSDITALGIPGQDNNTTYTVGTESYSGTTKLYGSTGTSTDGTMTRNAITTALNGKANSSHTHNYAGSSSAGGNANAAVKLATARKISLSGDATGSATFDGSADATITVASRKYCMVGSDAANSAGWYKFADITMSGYGDSNVMFSMYSTYAVYYSGILMVQLRSDNTKVSVGALNWLTRTGFAVGTVRAVISGMKITLYVNDTNTQYGRIMAEVISQSGINDKDSKLVLYNTTTKESTEPSSSIASKDSATVSYANSAGSVAWGNVSGKPNASQSAAGLMTAADKKKLDGIASGANAYTHPSATAYASGLYKITTNNLGHVTAATAVTKADITGLGIPSADTHYTTGLKVGASATATANAAATNGNVYINALDNTTVRDSHKVVGSGATTVTSDANGVITVNSTNTTYSDATQSAHGLMTAADKKKLDGIASGANAYTHPSHTAYASGLYKITTNNLGHVTAATAVTKADITGLGIPASDTNTHYNSNLITGASATATANAAATNGNLYLNLVENGAIRNAHNVVGTGGTTVVSDANGKVTINSPSYSAASQSANGLMSAADKKKLDGIATGANAYTHPSATAYASGLYKITTNNLGHVTAATAVTKADITALGIPGQDSNTTYTVGTESYSGTTKLYGSTGTSTDGTMTRNAITTALNGKANSSHTHNYAGSSSAGGSANTAVKLATARTVATNNGDFNLSFSYDGSANSTASLSYYSCSAYNGNKNNYPFHRFAKLDTITGSYNDKASTFLITQDYQCGGWGIVTIRLRTNSSTQASDVEVKWLARYNLAVDFVQVAIDTTAGATYADAFLKLAGSYGSLVVRNLASGSRGSVGRTWTLINSKEVDNTTTTDALTSTESYVNIATAGTKLHNKAYTKTVTPSDGATVSYANSSGTASNVKDSGNNTVTTLAYSKSGLDTTSWFAAWNNYELRAISPANALKAMGGASTAVASQSANGLLSAADKKKLDGIASGANAYSHPSATAYASGLYKITTNNLGHVTAATAVTKADITALGIPGQDTNSHYRTNLIVGKADSDQSVSAQTNGNVCLKIFDDSEFRGGYIIKGTGATTVTSASDGTITINSTNTVYSHPSATAYSSGLYKITTNNLGHVTAATKVAKSDITALGIPAQDTTYSDVTTSNHGLMTAADKTKLNGISSGAQNTVYSASQPSGQAIGDYWVKLEG